jgi:Family of unknown function (DUF6518)
MVEARRAMRYLPPVGSKRAVGVVFLAAAVFGLTMAVIKGQGAGARDAFGNISAPWLLLPFVAGATSMRLRSAALIGLGASLAALVVFYVAESQILDLGSHSWPVDLRLAVTAGQTYLVTSLLSGPVFGFLGGIWSQRRSLLAAVAVAAMFVLEPLAVWGVEHAQGHVASTGLLTQYPWMWIGEMLLGVVGGVLLVRVSRRSGSTGRRA